MGRMDRRTESEKESAAERARGGIESTESRRFGLLAKKNYERREKKRGFITSYPNLSPDSEIYPNLLKP